MKIIKPTAISQVPNAPPDGVIVHRKYRDEADVLVYDVRARASTRQAQVRGRAVAGQRRGVPAALLQLPGARCQLPGATSKLMYMLA